MTDIPDVCTIPGHTVWLSRADLAERLSVSTRTIDRLRARGMPAVRKFRRTLFDAAEVDAWLRKDSP